MEPGRGLAGRVRSWGGRYGLRALPTEPCPQVTERVENESCHSSLDCLSIARRQLNRPPGGRGIGPKLKASATSIGIPGASPGGRPTSNSPPTWIGRSPSGVDAITALPSASNSDNSKVCFLVGLIPRHLDLQADRRRRRRWACDGPASPLGCKACCRRSAPRRQGAWLLSCGLGGCLNLVGLR